MPTSIDPKTDGGVTDMDMDRDMDADLRRAALSLATARGPEDVFGALPGTPEQQVVAARSAYRRLARACHPDRFAASDHMQDRRVAERTFRALTALWEQARQEIGAGVYGAPAGETAPRRAEQVRVRGRRREYLVGQPLAMGDLATLYRCSFALDGAPARGVFKVARDPADNGLLENEARSLRRLGASPDRATYGAYVPTLVDSLRYTDPSAPGGPRQANVLTYAEGLYTFEEVMEHYPRGVDPRDMAWMWRRLLVALGVAHRNGRVHGAVLPPHVLIQPEGHGLVLIDWSYAVHDPATTGDHVAAISVAHEAWYPDEVLRKRASGPGTDIAMAARCMVALLGGDPVVGTLPPSAPHRLRAFFHGCTLPGLGQRPGDAWDLLAEFDDLIERLWGPRAFRPFHMPARPSDE